MTVHNGWAYDWEDRVTKVQGADIKIELSLPSGLMKYWAQRHALTLAHSVKTNQPLMLKVTYEYVGPSKLRCSLCHFYSTLTNPATTDSVSILKTF